jgi:hypothetical protein
LLLWVSEEGEVHSEAEERYPLGLERRKSCLLVEFTIRLVCRLWHETAISLEVLSIPVSFDGSAKMVERLEGIRARAYPPSLLEETVNPASVQNPESYLPAFQKALPRCHRLIIRPYGPHADTVGKSSTLYPPPRHYRTYKASV